MVGFPSYPKPNQIPLPVHDTYHAPEQYGVAESFMGTLKLECVWQHRFETYGEAKAAIIAWIRHYNETGPHSCLGYLPPVEWRRRRSELSA